MKRLSKIGCIFTLLIMVLSMSACGGLHNDNAIYAKDLKTDENLKIDIKVTHTADTGNYDFFSTEMNFEQLADYLEESKNIKSVQIYYHKYILLTSENDGYFLIKYLSRIDESYYYGFFAPVGKLSDLGEYIHIPYHLLKSYAGDESPTGASVITEEDIIYNTDYDLQDFSDFYVSTGLYATEQYNDYTLIVRDNSSDFTFYILLSPENEELIFDVGYGSDYLENYFGSDVYSEVSKECSDEDEQALQPIMKDISNALCFIGTKEDAENKFDKLSALCMDSTKYYDAVSADCSVELLTADLENDTGYMWIKYNRNTYDENGDFLSGRSEAVARISLKKHNDEWIAEEVNEAP